LLGILHCLRTFRIYLYGRRFKLRIDPTAVKGTLRDYKPVEAVISRWVAYIWQFDYELEIIPGARNRADGLSRVEWGTTDPNTNEEALPIDDFLEHETDSSCPSLNTIAGWDRLLWRGNKLGRHG
jgi:hypothetical protein